MSAWTGQRGADNLEAYGGVHAQGMGPAWPAGQVNAPVFFLLYKPTYPENIQGANETQFPPS